MLDNYSPNFKILSKKDLGEDTNFMEFGKGSLPETFWNDSSYYCEEGAFAVLEGCIYKRFPSYDHYDNHEIPKEIGLMIINDWKLALIALSDTSLSTAQSLFDLHRKNDYWTNYLKNNYSELLPYINNTSNLWESIYKEEECLFIIGM